MASSLEMIRKQRRALQTAQGEASAADIKEAKETDKRERPYIFPVK